MPRPLFSQPTKQQTNVLNLHTAAPAKTETKNEEQQMQMARLLKKQRSKEYMEAIHKLDAGGHTMSAAQREAIIAAIRAEFPEVLDLAGVLIGIVAKCYLGDPYEVHTITIIGNIIEHYKRGQALPDGMERARSLAARGGYEFVEVYTDVCRAVSSDGSVSVVQ
jgi:hypothetical protein